ncbi:hypothetical protein BGY98DRAFT_951257 [Russula aff. rugulosa BPL654]|nr:hypothetical protein BGY98DRAFT_951257 [Russula aff. rugulosa BPL654]
MRRYKIVASILLILSVFSFVLAAPIAVREVREACTNGVDGEKNILIGSSTRKRAQPGEDREPLLAQVEEPLSSSGRWSSPSQQLGSSSAPNYASGAEEGRQPLLAQGEEPLSSSSQWSTPSQQLGSSSAPNYASGTNPNPSFSSEGKAKSIQPGASIEMQPMSSAGIQPMTSTKIQQGPPSLTDYKKSVSFAPLRGVSLPTGEIHLEFAPSDDERPILPSSPGPEREQNLLQLQIAALRNPPKKSQSQGKKLWKLVYSKLRKLRPWRRFSRTAVATEG